MVKAMDCGIVVSGFELQSLYYVHIVIVVGNGHGDTSSKSWTRLIAYHIALIPLGKVWIQLFLPPAMSK